MKIVYLSLLFYLFLIPDALTQPEPGNLDVTISGTTFPLYQQSYALLIGISNYNNGWPALPGVTNDLYKIRTALEKQGFSVMAIWDPEKDQLDDAITDFIKNFGQDRSNRLVIYYAGHGYTAKSSYGELIGYLIPVDAPRPHLDVGKFQARAIEIAQFDLYSKRIQSNHALFIFDACFSGSLFTGKTLPEPLTPKVLEPVRQFITSGSADEQVPDKSIFCEQFIQALDGYGDNDRDGYITGTELGEYLQKSVINYSRNTQHPQFGKIQNPRLDKGEIIFTSLQSAVGSGQSTAGSGQSAVGSKGSSSDSRPSNSTTVTILPAPTTPASSSTPFTSQQGETRSTGDITPTPQSQTLPKGEKEGELKVISSFSGDLYIDWVFYRTILANTTVMIYNTPSGNQHITLKGDSPWQATVEIRKNKVTVVEIK